MKRVTRGKIRMMMIKKQELKKRKRNLQLNNAI
jgi:hypothetical protein